MTPEHDSTDAVGELLQRYGPRPAPSTEALAAARAHAHDAWQAEVGRNRRRRHSRVAAFALAAAALVILVLGRYRLATPVAPLVTAATIATSNATLHVDDVFRTNNRAGSRLTLANGVELRLDVDTEIRFLGRASVALERGGVFVDTGSSGTAGQSVEIRTRGAITRDVGTRFEVRVLVDATRVRVRDGIVQLTQGTDVHTARRGTELLAASSGVAQREISVVGADWNWIALAGAPFNIEGKTLSRFLEWATREGGWDIQFADAALRRSTAGIVLHGSIAGLTPQEALDTILPTCGLTHHVNSDVVIVESAARAGDRR
jgi:hypothetical protein